MDDVSENYFKKEMLERYNAQTSDIPMLTFLAYEPKDDSIRWWDVSYMILIGIILGSQYSVMTYCGWNMYFKMEEKIQTFSVALKHHHRQLFKTLVLQITAPALFLFSPIVIISSLTFFHLEVSFPAGVAICAFSFYPALDSVIVLIVVTEYRVVARTVYAGVYSLTISLIAVQFIYRYWTLFKIRCLTYFDGWRSLIWVFYCLLFAVSWGIGACHLLEMDTTSEDYFSEEMFLRYNASSSATPMLTFLAYDPGYGCLRYRNFLYLVLISTVMGFQYTVMWYCGYRMYIKMEEKIAGFSRALRNHHRQLFKTLVLQITAPTIFLFSPLIPIMFLPFFQLELNFPAGAAFSAFSFYPAFDSIIVLLVVKEYRQVARRTFATVLLNILSREQGSVRTYSFPMTSLAVSTVM